MPRQAEDNRKRISHGLCPLCDETKKLLASWVFKVECCKECLLGLAKAQGWV